MKKTELILMSLLFFGCTLNALIDFPLEKLFMVIALVVTVFFYYRNISIDAFRGLLLLSAAVVLSLLFNISSFNYLLIFPILGYLFIILISNNHRNFIFLYWGLWIHIFLGLVFVVHSYLVDFSEMTRFVRPMMDKGLPFLHASTCFTPTVQSFGTMSLSWLLLYSNRLHFIPKSRFDNVAFIIVLLALICTFNRNTYVLFILYIFYYYRRFFYVVFSFAIIGTLYYMKFISQLFLNMKTVDSRRLGLEGFYLSYIKSDSLLVYMFGRGDDMVEEIYTTHTVLGLDYQYIENGAASILHSIGLIGFIIYGIICLYFILNLVLKRQWFLSIFSFYLLFIAQLFTNEFFASTFYIILVVICLISTKNEANFQNVRIFPKLTFLKSVKL